MPTQQAKRRRNSTPTSNPYPKDKPSLKSSAQLPPTLNGVPGFPTRDQYKRIESNYLTLLHPRKRDKALINQAMFDRIWDTFMHPGSRHETPQFRFWVRKMFTLSEPPTFLSSSGESAEAIQPVVLHDNRPVAIQEQIYDIICYCHARAEHGGRDKTRAVVREHYSWVPKELVSQFVKACPTCTLKKCGNAEVAAILEQQMIQAGPISHTLPQQRAFPLPNPLSDPDVKLRPTTPGDLGEQQTSNYPCSEVSADFLQGSLSESCDTPSDFASSIGSSRRPSPVPGLESNQVQGARAHYLPEALAMSREPRSLPMSREVSLYRGLPNGWQYRGEYPEALEFHTKGKRRKTEVISSGEAKRVKRPRIPSVLPFGHIDNAERWGQDKENEQETCPEGLVTLPSLKEALSEASSTNRDVIMTPIPRIPQSSLPQSLQRYQVFLPVAKQAEATLAPGSHLPQIDPVLLNEGHGGVTGIQSSDALHWKQSKVLPASHVIDYERHARLGSFEVTEKYRFPTTASIAANTSFPKSQTLRAGPIRDAGQGVPLQSFQSFQHLLDWKNDGASHDRPQDDSPRSPFSPRAPFVSSTASSCFSTFHASSVDEESHFSAGAGTHAGPVNEPFDFRVPVHGEQQN